MGDFTSSPWLPSFTLGTWNVFFSSAIFVLAVVFFCERFLVSGGGIYGPNSLDIHEHRIGEGISQQAEAEADKVPWKEKKWKSKSEKRTPLPKLTPIRNLLKLKDQFPDSTAYYAPEIIDFGVEQERH
ncbi:hypothetical protein D5086_024888 [Populus alba]|uniref:Uncharacterized protein n=1 Tax=Populus alba TaxID=43335 RepID=A0ACC4B701_POPAL